MIVHHLSVQSPGLHTLRELLRGLVELLEDGVDGGVVPDRRGGPVVGVELLNVSHWEVGLKTDCSAEVHYGFVGLVYQEMDLRRDIVMTRLTDY